MRALSLVSLQVEGGVPELRQGEEHPAANGAPPEAAPMAPGDAGSVAPEPPTEGADRRGAAPTGSPMDEPPPQDMGRKQDEPEEEKEQVEEGKEQEARAEAAGESSSASGPGEGPENRPTPMEHHPASEEGPESPGSALSDQKEEAGSALLEAQPAESPGETAVEAIQTEVPAQDPSP